MGSGSRWGSVTLTGKVWGSRDQRRVADGILNVQKQGLGSATQPTEKTERRGRGGAPSQEMGGEDWGCIVCLSLHGGVVVRWGTGEDLGKTNRSLFSPAGL